MASEILISTLARIEEAIRQLEVERDALKAIINNPSISPMITPGSAHIGLVGDGPGVIMRDRGGNPKTNIQLAADAIRDAGRPLRVRDIANYIANQGRPIKRRNLATTLYLHQKVTKKLVKRAGEGIYALAEYGQQKTPQR